MLKVCFTEINTDAGREATKAMVWDRLGLGHSCVGWISFGFKKLFANRSLNFTKQQCIDHELSAVSFSCSSY